MAVHSGSSRILPFTASSCYNSLRSNGHWGGLGRIRNFSLVQPPRHHPVASLNVSPVVIGGSWLRLQMPFPEWFCSTLVWRTPAPFPILAEVVESPSFFWAKRRCTLALALTNWLICDLVRGNCLPNIICQGRSCKTPHPDPQPSPRLFAQPSSSHPPHRHPSCAAGSCRGLVTCFPPSSSFFVKAKLPCGLCLLASFFAVGRSVLLSDARLFPVNSRCRHDFPPSDGE